VKLLLIGFGTVGQGLAELLIGKQKELQDQYGLEIQVVGIGDMLKGSVYNPGGIDLQKCLELAKADDKISALPDSYDGDALSLINKADADMMVEATYTDIKTAEPATSHIRAALEKGMHVTTTNKGPLALYTLAGSTISEIKGILNGTTNYILTKMEEGLLYEDALKKAQELGYAEAVPDADVLGWDALAKVTILANTVFGSHSKPDDFPCKGITDITAEAITEAKSQGKRFKLIGKVWRDGDDVKGSVAPEEVDLTHPLAGIMGAINAVTISTDVLGDVTIVGPGAGRTETGYSALVDIIHVGGIK